MFKTKTYRDAAELARDAGDDPRFAADLDAHLSERRLVRHLFALRCARGLSQADIAAKMGCSQGRISKLEASRDEDLSFGDIRGYARALGLKTILGFEDSGIRAVDMVKFHASRIKSAMDDLAKLCGEDKSLALGVSQFFGEAAFNLIRMVEDATNKLPEEVRKHGVCLVEIVGPDGETSEVTPSPSRKPKAAPSKKRKPKQTV